MQNMKEVMNIKFDLLQTSGYANFNVSTITSVENANQYISDELIIPDFVDRKENNTKYPIVEVANWFLLKQPMTHKKLQKLCYYAQAWCYALKNYRFIDSDFQAWIHGPVSPILYEQFKSFRFDTIRIKKGYISKIKKEDQEFLEDIWATYGSYTGNALEALSHSELPWIRARAGYRINERCTVVISPEAMKEYYLSIYNK